MKNRQIFSGMQILSANQLLANHAVIVEDNLINAIVPVDRIKNYLPAQQHEFDSSCYLIPGMIDLHVHGANGKDVMDADPGSLTVISEALAREGVTGFLATTMTAENQHLENALATVAEYKQAEAGASILGVHLEGPFISREKMGAQNAKYAQLPNVDLIKSWQKIADQSIKLVTLAPELPGAIELIKALKSMNITVSVGHTNATYEETCHAIAAGCTQATHLFNAMSGIHQRKPGATCALLLASDTYAELIADGLHLSPAIVKLAYQMKTKLRVLLVSDAMRAKCMGDGCYDLGGQDVHVKSGKATLADGTLAGSTLHLPQAVKNMVEYTGCSLIDAVQMATLNPAQALGIAQRKGSIAVGKDADLVILDSDLYVLQTMRAGKPVFSKQTVIH